MVRYFIILFAFLLSVGFANASEFSQPYTNQDKNIVCASFYNHHAFDAMRDSHFNEEILTHLHEYEYPILACLIFDADWELPEDGITNCSTNDGGIATAIFVEGSAFNFHFRTACPTLEFLDEFINAAIPQHDEDTFATVFNRAEEWQCYFKDEALYCEDEFIFSPIELAKKAVN